MAATKICACEVENLLYFEQLDSDFLEVQAVSAVLENRPQKIEKKSNSRKIGNYEVIKELGAGGMGVVFLAERADGAFNQKTALKLIKRGMDSDAILRRFHNERQILADLNHPNIARLLDGGTTDDGLPYFVMEHIEGQPLDEYCDRHNLSISERLEIFRRVCAAVGYAHQKFGYSPRFETFEYSSNWRTERRNCWISVSPKFCAPIPRRRRTDITETMFRAMTPRYASPEQIQGRTAYSRQATFTVWAFCFTNC